MYPLKFPANASKTCLDYEIKCLIMLYASNEASQKVNNFCFELCNLSFSLALSDCVRIDNLVKHCIA
jgi:hypothetical protein